MKEDRRWRHSNYSYACHISRVRVLLYCMCVCGCGTIVSFATNRYIHLDYPDERIRLDNRYNHSPKTHPRTRNPFACSLQTVRESVKNCSTHRWCRRQFNSLTKLRWISLYSRTTVEISGNAFEVVIEFLRVHSKGFLYFRALPDARGVTTRRVSKTSEREARIIHIENIREAVRLCGRPIIRNSSRQLLNAWPTLFPSLSSFLACSAEISVSLYFDIMSLPCTFIKHLYIATRVLWSILIRRPNKRFLIDYAYTRELIWPPSVNLLPKIKRERLKRILWKLTISR